MKLQLFFDRFIKIVGFVLFFWIVILLVGFEKIIDYSYSRELVVANFVIVIAFAILAAILIVLKKRIKLEFPKINYDKIVDILITVFLIMQIVIFYNFYFETAWDPYAVTNAAREISYTQGLTTPAITYLSYNSNNVLITLFYAFILKLNLIFGLFPIEFDLMGIIIINCVISSFTSYLVYKIGKQLFNDKIAFIGYLVSVIMLVFSPWNIICYSDALTLFMPVLMLKIYLNKESKYYVKYPLLLFFGYLTYLIKPQSAIIIIAILIIELIKRISKVSKQMIKKGIIISAISVVPIFLFAFSINGIIKLNNIELDKEKELGVAHYLMVGVNKESNGAFSYGDATVSKLIETKKERNQRNIELFFERMKEYGVGGYFTLLSKKLLTLYNDGSFSWAMEGDFFFKSPENNSVIAKIFKNIYHGEAFYITNLVLQIIWIFCIISIFINLCINLFKKSKIDYVYLVIVLTVIGLTIFELLFEVRARYLYSNVPIYILLMMYAIHHKWGFLNGNK